MNLYLVDEDEYLLLVWATSAAEAAELWAKYYELEDEKPSKLQLIPHHPPREPRAIDWDTAINQEIPNGG